MEKKLTIREKQAEDLKSRVFEIMQSEENAIYCPSKVIEIVPVSSEIFVEMAFCFIAKHGK